LIIRLLHRHEAHAELFDSYVNALTGLEAGRPDEVVQNSHR